MRKVKLHRLLERDDFSSNSPRGRARDRPDGRRLARDRWRAALTFANGTTITFPNQIGGLAMSRRIMLSVFAIMVAAMNASAADLPVQSRLGAIFAEPAEIGTRADGKREYSAPMIAYNRLPNPIWARGGYYYGSPWSYDSGPYYRGASVFDGGRLPYVCGLYGYC